MQHHVIYTGGAQTLRFVPIDKHGKPTRITSATYTIVDLRRHEDDSQREIVASTAASLGSETETLSAAAGRSQSDPRRLSVADASDFTEGRTYLVSEAGKRESFVADRIDTASTPNAIYARHALREDFTTSATVNAIELAATFPSAQAADETDFDDGGGPYMVVWAYTSDGNPVWVPEIVWTSRYSVVPSVTPDLVLSRYPGFATSVARPGDIEASIRNANQDFVAELEASGKDPRLFKAPTAAQLAVANRAIEYLLRWRGSDESIEQAEVYRERYESIMRNLLTGVPDKGTVEIRRTEATAPPGSSKFANRKFFLPS